MKITCAAIALLTGLLMLAPASTWAAHDGDTSATCADANGDDGSGLTSVPVGFQNEATGERLVALLEPEAGEIAEEGWPPVIVRIGDAPLNGIAHLVLPRGGFESRH